MYTGGAVRAAGAGGSGAFAGSGAGVGGFATVLVARFFFFGAVLFPFMKKYKAPPIPARSKAARRSQAHHGKLLLPLDPVVVVVTVVAMSLSACGLAPAQSFRVELHGTGQC
jgi:hypothetical protein